MSPSVLLTYHIVAGVIGLLSGAAALAFRKGTNKHKIAGNVFVVSMLVLAAGGVYLANGRGPFNGILTLYLVITSWLTVKRKPKNTTLIDWLAVAVVFAVCVANINLGWQASQSEMGLKDGFPAGVHYFFASIAGLAGLLDLNMIYHRGLQGQHRIARHLWRMIFALWIATTSLFLGQAQLFPEPIRKIEVLAIPVVIVMLFMLYWLIRVLFLAPKKSRYSQDHSD
ncbi:MAG: putative membrane protein [Paraglaciecola sp.]|jgi:uncharacterized membrane protein